MDFYMRNTLSWNGLMAIFPVFEINLQKETYGKHKWERAFAYPLIGVSFLYTGLGKSPELGSAIFHFSIYRFSACSIQKFYR
jgi:hypothetical protein